MPTMLERKDLLLGIVFSFGETLLHRKQETKCGGQASAESELGGMPQGLYELL